MNSLKSLFVKNNVTNKRNHASKNNGPMNGMNAVVVEEDIVVKNNAANNAANNAGLAKQPFTQTPNQAGGVAPLSMRDANLQPSEAVMKWATTAGAETPSAAEMRNVAHGGARKKTRKHKKSKKSKSHKKAKKTRKQKKQKKQKKSKKNHKRK